MNGQVKDEWADPSPSRGDVYGRVAHITRFSMGSCILGRKTISYVEETRIIRISDQKTSIPLIICMRDQPRMDVVNTHASCYYRNGHM